MPSTKNPARRNSRVETTNAATSPFRSAVEVKRTEATVRILLKREAEIVVLQARLVEAKTAMARNALRTRIAATQRSLQSWIDYANQDAPRVKGAVITP